MIYGMARAVERLQRSSISLEDLAVFYVGVVFVFEVILVDLYFWRDLQEILHARRMIMMPVRQERL